MLISRSSTKFNHEDMMKRLFGVVLAAILAGCGGGGDSSPSAPAAQPTYFQQGGLTWSSTSNQTYYYVPLGSLMDLSQSNGYYCNGSTNGVLNNFNKEPGWRLPTFSELQKLYKEMPKPPGWTIGPVWASGNSAINFADGGIIIGGNTEASKYRVACVKP